MRVALIATGQLEYRALDTALSQLFPRVEFVSLPANRGPLDGFTSGLVSNSDAARNDTTSVRKLAAQVVSSVEPGQPRSGRFDFAFLIEDLELVNDGHLERVVELVREAVSAHVRSSFPAPHRADVFDRVKRTCSFHLLRPMVEAYFFGDSDALARARIQRQPQLDSARDFEQLLVTDPEYLEVADDNEKLKAHHGGAGDRARHPKSYMTYLCDPQLAKKRPYRETHEGVAALEQLNWQRVIQAAAMNCPFLSAMLDDLAWAVEQPLDWVTLGQTAELTRMKSDAGTVLRNI